MLPRVSVRPGFSKRLCSCSFCVSCCLASALCLRLHCNRTLSQQHGVGSSSSEAYASRRQMPLARCMASGEWLALCTMICEHLRRMPVAPDVYCQNFTAHLL